MGATAAGLADECSAFRDGCRSDWFSASEPVHPVLLRSYYIDAHEVTNASYVEFLNQNGDSCFEQPCIDLMQSQLAQDNDVFAMPWIMRSHRPRSRVSPGMARRRSAFGGKVACPPRRNGKKRRRGMTQS